MQISNYSLTTTNPVTLTQISPTIVTASLVASGWNQEVTNGGTITGPAPLGIFFDATGTTSTPLPTDTFRELGYHFDFGYPTPTTPGTWTYNGEPKGNQVGGPLAAHVYETPGTYIASVRAQDVNGNYSGQSVTIIVQDPNTIYAGTSTVCISLVGDFTGAPAGATTTTSIPTSLNSNTRYLFRCNENYSGTNYVSSMNDTTDVITLASTTGLAVNNAIKFRGTPIGNVKIDTTYYILSISGNDITISQTLGGALFNIGYTGTVSSLRITLTITSLIDQNKEKIQVSFYGTGSKPLIYLTFRTTPPTIGNFTQRSITIYGIENCIEIATYFSNYVTILNCKQVNYQSDFNAGTTVQYYYANPISNQDNSLCTWPKNLILQGNYFDCNYVNAPGSGNIFLLATRFAILGNETYKPWYQHLRSPFWYKSIVAHNYFDQNINNQYSQLKFHAPVDAANAPFSTDLAINPKPASQYAVIADNYVAADDNLWQFAVQPENAQSFELCKDAICERNYFESSPSASGSQRALMNAGVRLTCRDNTIAPGRPASNNYGVDGHTGELPPSMCAPYFLPADNALIDNVRVYPNTPTVLPQGPIKSVFRVAAWGQEVTDTGTITGPAPLAVFFDATATTATQFDSMRLCGYHFDFGYGNVYSAGTWTYSGKPKGNQVGGPTAAHVYETPGTYTASLRAQTPNGNYQDKFVTIEVQDPEVYWTTGGRTTVTLLRNSITSWPTWASNTRYLLEAGQNYASLTSSAIRITSVQNVCISKTGVGADPNVSDLQFAYTTGTTPPTAARVIFSQLNATGGDLNAAAGGTDCLFYKCTGQNPITGTLIESNWVKDPTKSWPRPRRICYYENQWNGNAINLPFFNQSYELMLLGNNSDMPREHGIRVQGMQYGFIGHNWVQNMGSGNLGPKSGITFRANGYGPLSPIMSSLQTYTPASRYVVIADNLIGSSTQNRQMTWPMQVSSENARFQEAIELVVVERNIYANIPIWAGYPIVEASRSCRNITIRDGNFSAFSPPITNGTSFGPGYGTAPPEWINGPVYSNTFRTPPDNIYTFYTPTGLLPNKAGTL